jgi:hypothetical protein
LPAGRSTHSDDSAVAAAVRAVVNAELGALLGLEPFPALSYDGACRAAANTYGWPDPQPIASIAPQATTAGLAAAARAIGEVAAAGGRIAFATARPASLLPLFQQMARASAASGATVLTATGTPPFRAEGRTGRRVWWSGGVAVVVDGQNLIAVRGTEAADEWLFTLPRPQLVVADHGFAGLALRHGIASVAFADVDAPVFAVAATRDLPCIVVPLDDQSPPAAYDAVEAMLRQ